MNGVVMLILLVGFRPYEFCSVGQARIHNEGCVARVGRQRGVQAVRILPPAAGGAGLCRGR